MRVQPGKEALPAGCGQCRGDPFVMGPGGMTRCSCARGTALREMDRQRDAHGSSRSTRAARRGPVPDWKAAACAD